MTKWILGLLVLCGLLGVGWHLAGRPSLPDRFNPTAALVIDDAPNFLTGYKLKRLTRDGPQCLAVLSKASGMSVAPVTEQPKEGGCGLSNVVRIERAKAAFSPRSPMTTCGAAVAWAMFERHVLDAAAQRALGSSVTRVEHLGSYACRNMYHRDQGRRSEHATANAIDISGFVLQNGQRIQIERDWDSADARRAAFLRDVRDGACRFFNVVLGPDYNEAHRNHFHFDMGNSRACR